MLGAQAHRISKTKLWTTVLALALLVALAQAAPAAGAKKKAAGIVDVTQAVNALVPDRGSGLNSQRGLLTSTISVGNQFKGKRIRDVNVTVQTTGVIGPTAADNMIVKLTAPNGATTTLFGGISGNAVGPVTLDDETVFTIGLAGNSDPTALGPPYQGTMQPAGPPLFALDDGPVTGTWTLRALDQNAGETYVLDFWRLNVIAGKPYRTK